MLMAPASIVLIDDILTRGHTFLGAAWRLHEAFPETKIVAFAAMRTISKEKELRLDGSAEGIYPVSPREG